MPITTITHAPSVPPMMTVKLFDEEAVLEYFSTSAETDLNGKNNLKLCKKLLVLLNRDNIIKSYKFKHLFFFCFTSKNMFVNKTKSFRHMYTFITFLSVFTAIQTSAVIPITRLVDAESIARMLTIFTICQHAF